VVAFYRGLTSPAPPRSAPRILPGDVLNALLEQPFLAEWLHFRMASMSEFVSCVTRAIRAAPRVVNVGLECQFPTLSRLVGTDFGMLAESFDWLTPKFPDYITASTIPFIASEIARSGSWRMQDLRRELREVLELGPGPQEYVRLANPPDGGVPYANTFDPSVIDLQVRHLAGLRDVVPIYPYIWHYDDLQLLSAKRDALRRNGFDGFFLWTGERDLTSEGLRASAGLL
jgi:hypothetical protein